MRAQKRDRFTEHQRAASLARWRKMTAKERSAEMVRVRQLGIARRKVLGRKLKTD